MTHYYPDTSALVKRYVAEQGTHWIRTLTATGSGNAIIVSRLTSIELMSAIARRHREGQFTSNMALGLKRVVIRHMAKDYDVLDVSTPITNLAIDLLLRHPLRTNDAVQLASAMMAHQRLQSHGVHLIFLSADQRLTSAANVEGLQTDDPNLH